ncbi:MAG: hypothetical protein ABJN62_08930 [Halioglobus sp.]
MKRIILHIGTEKTATTSLQAFFSLNHSQLSEKGIWYPNSESLDYCHRNAHFPLAASVMETCPDFVSRNKYFQPEELFQKLLHDFDQRDEKTLLLSSEHFSSRCSRPERNLKLAKLLDGRNVQILVYLRPQDEMLLSSYSTFLKSGGKKTLEEVSRKMWLRPKALYFNHSLMVRRWLANFPKENFSVRIFQKPQLVDGDIYADVMNFLNIELESPKYSDRLNPPISKELADFLYLANQHFPTWQEGDRKGFEQGQRFRGEIVPLFAGGRSIKNLLSPELMQDTRAYFSEYNRQLCDLVRPDLNGQLFIDPPITEIVGADEHSNDNYFSEEFVAWVINQWSAKSGFHRKISALSR